MDWLNLHISTTVRSPEYVGSSPAERGTWVSVLAYACEIECGGRLVGAAAWKDRQWQQSCGVTLREVRTASRLMRFEGDDLLINGYPAAKENQVRQARGVGMAGAMKRWGKNDADRYSENMPPGMPTANAEGKGREGKGKGSAPMAHDPHPLASLLASMGLASDPSSCAEWMALMLGPVVRIAEGMDYGTAIEEIVAQARRDNPAVQYSRHCATAAAWWAQRRDQREAAKNRPPTPLPEPEVPRETPQEACARRLRGELNPIERTLFDGARAHVGPAGEWIKGPKIADWMNGAKPDPVAAT